MFRTQQNVFDDAVVKATDENLTTEDWSLILDVCDKANSNNDSAPKDVVAAMIKRLAHRNANVQLYTLELANALSQNCGVSMHRELASRSFTDALLRLAGDRTTHQQVKSKILERMDEWTSMFRSNTELGIMEQAYMRLKSQNPNLQPPQAPTKRQITDIDRQKEEEELQMALKLSIQDKPTPGPSTLSTAAAELSGQPASIGSQSQPSHPLPSGTTAATVSRVRALFDFQPSESGELQFRKGDVIAVLESVYKDWWKGSLRGQMGIFPLNYVEKLSDPTQEELQKEAQMEAEVFGEIKNVEKLLALLSTSCGDLNARENEEITELYNSTLAIRPKLIELIGKYTQKKDDFQQLNEKFIKARRDYEALLETSMAQSAQQYGRSGTQPPYGYPPSQPGYPPQRFYTPGPEPQAPNGVTPYQYPQQHTLQQNQAPYPISSPPPQSHTPSGPRPSQPPQDTYNYPPQLQAGGRRKSSYDQQLAPYAPQESGVSAHDPSVDSHHQPPRQSYPPLPAPGMQIVQAQENDTYSPSVYATEEQQSQQPHPPHQGIPHVPFPQQQQKPPYQQHQNQFQPPPSHHPPPPPSSEPSRTPVPQPSGYPAFAPPGQPPAGYQAYQRSDGFMGSPGAQPQGQQAYASGGGNPAGFYR